MRGNTNTIAQRLFYTDNGMLFVSIVLGLGAALIFRKVCKDRKCIIITAPTPEEMKYTYELEGDCYKYTPKATECADKESFNLLVKNNNTK